jgi:ribA/ribD-fused uncharacterized protein
MTEWTLRGTQPQIDFFDGTEYDFLSNFHPSPFLFQKFMYPTVEHAFQTAKSLDPMERSYIAHANTPGQAKYLGRTCTLRADWERIKDGLMYDMVLQKFLQNPFLKEKLMDTGTRLLIEGNTWGDKYWGQVNGVGRNQLGITLMQVRYQISRLDALTVD